MFRHVDDFDQFPVFAKLGQSPDSPRFINEMNEMIKNSLKLSEGSTVEEKIASISIALQLFDTNFKSNQKISHKYITQIAKNIGPQFIKQLIINSERLRDIAIKLLYILIDLPDILSEFTSLLQPIILNTLNNTTQKSSSQGNSIDTIKKLIELSDLSTLKSTFHTLLYIASTNTHHPQTLIDLLCECCLYIQYQSETTITHTTATSTNSIISLNINESASLRSLFIQSLHGALPSEARNTVYKHLADLLQTHHTVIDTTWTVEEENNKNKGQFARLICSLIHGELQLYIEEFIDIYTHISGSGPGPGTGTGVGTGQHASVREADGASLSQMVIRSEIVYDMLQVFISFLETILSLLLGGQDNVGHNYDPSEENAGVWGVLGESVLSKVQHMAYASISELFDLFEWASERYDTFAGLIEEGRSLAASPLPPPLPQQQQDSSGQGGAAINPNTETALSTSPSQAQHRQRQVNVNDQLYTILKAAGRVVCGWVIEDESLSAQFLTHVSYMLPFSTLHPNYPRSTGGENVMSLESPTTTTTTIAATTVEEEVVAAAAAAGGLGGVVRLWRENDDMLVYIIPCLGALLEGQQQQEQTDNNDSNSRDSDDGSDDDDERGVVGEADILEKLCNIPHLITCLLHALSTLPPSPPLLSTQSSASYLQQLLIYEGTCEILTTLLIYKQRELKVLCISEGLSASFTSVYGYTVSAELITYTLSVLNKLVAAAEDENSGLGQCAREKESVRVCASVLSDILYT